MKTISKENFEKLFSLCRAYDPFTMYIDNYRQEVQAEKSNKAIMEKFSNVVKENYNIEVSFLPYKTTTEYSVDEAKIALKEWLLKNNVEIENKKRVWNKNEIKVLVQTNDKVLYGSLKALYDCQTADEKSCKDTKEHNGKGFNGVDAEFLSSCAEFLIKNGFLTPKQKIIVRRKLIKYNNQITKLANNA